MVSKIRDIAIVGTRALAYAMRLRKMEVEVDEPYGSRRFQGGLRREGR